MDWDLYMRDGNMGMQSENEECWRCRIMSIGTRSTTLARLVFVQVQSRDESRKSNLSFY